VTLLNLYRALAYVTGVVLAFGVLVVIPLQLLGHPVLEAPVFIAHGWLYMAYVVVTLVLSTRSRWSIAMTIIVAAAGTIPFAVFFAEHKVVALANEKAAARERTAA
jgi:integral membrane protein